jgi:hypothetical protein
MHHCHNCYYDGGTQQAVWWCGCSQLDDNIVLLFATGRSLMKSILGYSAPGLKKV